MKPSRELDALVAEKVMGHYAWQTDPDAWAVKDGTQYSELPHYSADIAEAWKVAEHIIRDHEDRNFHIAFNVFYDDVAAGWIAKFYIQGKVILSEEDPMSAAESAPHAICLAALKAVGNE